MMRKLKTKLAILSVLILRQTSRVLPVPYLQALLKPFRHTPLRLSVFNIWSRVLTYSGYRISRAEWSKTFWKRPAIFGSEIRDPVFGIHHALDQMSVGNFEINEVIALLKKDIFETNGDVGVHLQKRIATVGMINEIERTKSLGEREYFLTDSKLAKVYFRERMERAHAMRLENSVDLYAKCYLASINYDPVLVRRICARTLTPNGLHATACSLIDIAIARIGGLDENHRVNIDDTKLKQKYKALGGSNTKTKPLEKLVVAIDAYDDIHDTIISLELQKVKHLLELGEFKKVDAVLEIYNGEPAFKTVVSKLQYLRGDNTASSQLLRDIIRSSDSMAERSNQLGELAEQLEEGRDFEGSLSLYRAAYRQNQNSTLNVSQPATWRYVHALLAGEHWSEATSVLRSAQIYMWRFFIKLNKKSAKKLIERDYRLPENGGLVLGCWGIGDEFFRLGLWNQMANKSAKWAFTCEPRLESVLKRSLPNVDIIANSRTNGPNPVSEVSYWDDREGIPTNTDLARLTVPVRQAIEKHKNLLISETMFYEFIRRHCHIEEPTETPLLTLDPKELERVSDWLATLPKGLNVAISWRSGKRSASRDKSYTSLDEWGDILSVPGVNFINIQYSDSEEEKQEARDMFGANIIDMPGVSRKHDIETLLAICSKCDVVIAPCTAVREMAGASGAETWSLTTTPYLPDLWRIKPGSNRDKIFPSMQHFTAMEHGDKAGVLSAMGQELRNMSSNTSDVISHSGAPESHAAE